MKRALIALISTTLLALVPAGAQARDRWLWGAGGQPGTVMVVGTIVSVDPSSSTIVANATVLPDRGHHWGGDGRPSGDGNGGNGGNGGNVGSDFDFGGGLPAPTQVTITTDSNTTFSVDGSSGTIFDLAAGQRFAATFNGSSTDSLSMLVASPPVAVYAHAAPGRRQLYAFVGQVTAVDTTDSPSTVTVQVSQSFPSGLVGSSDNPATFTVGEETLILGGSGGNGLFGGTLSEVSVGDTVAGGVVGTAGETLTQVESSPLQALIDFPTAGSSGSSGGSSTTARARAARTRALRQALALFGHRTRSRGHARHTRGHARSRGVRHRSGRRG
jgi:hypothetical protein